MPKGKKTCPKCSLETGARAPSCQCGHQFSGSNALKPESHEEIIPAKKASKETKVQEPEDSIPNLTIKQEQTLKSSIQSPLIYAPAGACPIKPTGYQKDWPNGLATKEVIVEWIYNVLNSSNKNYTPYAIIYWAGQFWDITGPNCGEDYKRVRSIILETLAKDYTAQL